jgi:hypothetical protein
MPSNRAHGKDTEITIDGDNISPWTTTSELTREADEHDTTGYGVDDADYQGGLRRGAFTCGGQYEIGATGPHLILAPLIGTRVPVVRKPEGTGTGKPNEAFSGLMTKYVETNPVADIVTWSAEFRKCGAITDTTQA